MIGAQDEGTTIPEAVAMEAATVETEATESAGEVATATAPPPESGTTVAPAVSAEERAEPHPR
jgi:hypothetical protein